MQFAAVHRSAQRRGITLDLDRRGRGRLDGQPQPLDLFQPAAGIGQAAGQDASCGVSTAAAWPPPRFSSPAIAPPWPACPAACCTRRSRWTFWISAASSEDSARRIVCSSDDSPDNFASAAGGCLSISAASTGACRIFSPVMRTMIIMMLTMLATMSRNESALTASVSDLSVWADGFELG